MKSTVETVSPTRVRLAVEVPFEELKPSMDRAYKTIAKQVKVPGFRPGRVPAAIIDQRIGQAAVLDEAVQDAVPRAYAEAVRDNEVRALGQPDIELTSVDAGAGISFTAEVDVRPQFALPALDTIAVTVPGLAVTDEDVDERLGVLREKVAMLRAVDRPVAAGDYVNLDFAAGVDGAEIESRAGMSYEVGSGQLIDGLDEALLGAVVAEERSFSAELLGGEHAGKTAEVTVTVRSVKEKELPELDDEFAQAASEFDTVEELRADIRDRIGQIKLVEQVVQARDLVLEALLAAADVPLPASVVDAEFDWRWEALARRLSSAGLSLDGYLADQDQAREELEAEVRTAAEHAVKAQLVLDALAETEQVGVSDQELSEHVVLQAERYGVPPQQFVQQIADSGSFGAVVAEIRREKALTIAVDAAAVTDEDGGIVDPVALGGAALEPTAEPAGAGS
ncbi:MAG: trigger factor [Actinobacteria bacterium]|nr:trigger factor [Actinomycetota bacterium]